MATTSPSFGFDHLKEIGVLGRGAARGAPSEAASAAVPAPATKQQSPPEDKKAEKVDKKADKKADKAAEAPKAVGPAPAKAAAPAAAAEPFVEATPEQLKKMGKEERGAYHARRIAAAKAGPAPKAQPKATTKAERRAVQESQKKAKEDQKEKADEGAQLLADLKLQGLSEDQAKSVILEMKKAQPVEEDEEDDDDEEDEDFLGSVKRWLSEQEKKIPKDALRDFNMKVRFQGYVDTTPPDHMTAVLQLICAEAIEGVDLKAAKVQPGAVAKAVTPALTRWAPLLEPLYGKIDDILSASDAVCQAVMLGVQSIEGVPEAGVGAAVVGCLMAVREIDMIEDEDLLTGLKRLQPRSLVLDKFTEHLEDELEEDGSDSD